MSRGLSLVLEALVRETKMASFQKLAVPSLPSLGPNLGQEGLDSAFSWV